MSWWWMAPLGLATVGAVLLAVLARGLAAEAASLGRSTEALNAARLRLIEARGRLVVDTAGLRPTETRPGPR